ncbi:MAG: MFS transporter [Micromonosporaceae bacterium]
MPDAGERPRTPENAPPGTLRPPRTSAPPPGTLAPLRRPDFRRIWIGHGLSALGSHLTGLALPLLILDQTGSPLLAGLAGTLRMLAYLVAHLPAGALADRLRRRNILLVADVARGLCVVAIGIALVVGEPLSVPVLLTLSVLSAVVSSVADPAGQAATRHLVDGGELPAALALDGVRGQAIGLAAPLVGGLLYQIWPPLPFLVDAGSYAMSFLLVYAVRRPLGGGTPGRPASLLSDITTGVRYIGHSSFLRLYLVWAALGNFATAGIAFLVVLAVLPSGGTAVGAALACVSLGGLVGAALAPRAVAVPAGTAVPAVTGVRLLIAGVIAVRPTPVVLATGMTLIALLGPLVSVRYNAGLFTLVPDHLMGRVQSAMTLVGGSLYPFAAVLAGWLAEAMSIRTAMLAMAGVLGVVFALGLLRTLRPPERTAPAPAESVPEPVT